MAAPTKVLLWSPDEAEERVTKALEIMSRLDVDALHWDQVFAGVMMLLSAATLQQQQDIPVMIPRNLTDRK